MATIEDIQPQPWMEARHRWRGELISADGASTHRIAYCTICREVAQFAICKVLKEGPILVGDSIYEPRCTRHLPTDNPNWKDDASST